MASTSGAWRRPNHAATVTRRVVFHTPAGSKTPWVFHGLDPWCRPVRTPTGRHREGLNRFRASATELEETHPRIMRLGVLARLPCPTVLTGLR